MTQKDESARIEAEFGYPPLKAGERYIDDDDDEEDGCFCDPSDGGSAWCEYCGFDA